MAEDAVINQEVIRGLLQRAGLRVRLVENGVEALQALENYRPDAVLMDCQMPVMDGYEATRLIRIQPRNRDLPIIALTANVMDGDREKCIKAGMNDFVSKPVRMDDLLAVLVHWIRPERKTIPDEIESQKASESMSKNQLELPGIDTTFGLRMVAGHRDIYLKILKMFHHGKSVRFQAQLREARNSQNWPELSRLGHLLKGESRSIGAIGLGDLAEHLEQAAVNEDAAAVDEALEPVAQELEKILTGLAKFDFP